MSYQVIARKWRPSSFKQVVYQEHISRTLVNSIETGRIPHALLFAGPRGVGKTSMARVFARALNCESGPTGSPCGTCSQCTSITAGSSMDVYEIDGASNNGVDHIRNLRENINFAPVSGRYKIYIIDEVHMVTTNAFNALLKTLEEPPPHAVFVFATTEIHKIPETILSRCQKYFFKKIPVHAIVDHLQEIVKNEKYTVDSTALYPIARAADGAMRDAQSILEQVLAFSSREEKVGVEQVLSVLGILPLDSYFTLLEHVASGNAAGTMAEIERVISLGGDITRFVQGFMDTLRSLRLLKTGLSDRSILGLSSQEEETYSRVAETITDTMAGHFFRILVQLQWDLRFAANGRIFLEMALMDMIQMASMPSLASIVQRLEAGGSIDEGEPPSVSKDTTPKTSTQRVDNRPEDDSRPLPEKSMEGGPDLSPLKEGQGTVKQVKDAFFGQIIDKGDKNA